MRIASWLQRLAPYEPSFPRMVRRFSPRGAAVGVGGPSAGIFSAGASAFHPFGVRDGDGDYLPPD